MEKIVNKCSLGLLQSNIIIIIETEIDADPKTHIMKYIENVTNRHNLFKKCIIDKEDQLYFQECSDFDVKSHVVFVDANSPSDTLYKPLNIPMDGKKPSWMLYCAVDPLNPKCRISLQIHHLYGDGYKLIKLLTPDEVDLTVTFRQKPLKMLDRLYYVLVGTLLSIWLCVKFAANMVWNEKTSKSEVKEADYLIYDKISLERIKTYTKKHNITVNDFMLSLCIQSYKKYSGAKDGYVVCPINMTNTNQENNMLPMLVSVKNTDVHEQMNCFKYSLIMPLFSLLLDYFSNSTIKRWFNKCTSQVDVIYTNMIAPTINIGPHIKIKNMFFLINTPNDHVVSYNIISYEDILNLTVTFKEGIADPAQLKKCITSTLTYMLE